MRLQDQPESFKSDLIVPFLFSVVIPREFDRFQQQIYATQGRFNLNPVFIWNYDTTPAPPGQDQTAGDDGLWGFQLPQEYEPGMGPEALASGTAIINMGANPAQTPNAPVFTTNLDFNAKSKFLVVE